MYKKKAIKFQCKHIRKFIIQSESKLWLFSDDYPVKKKKNALTNQFKWLLVAEAAKSLLIIPRRLVCIYCSYWLQFGPLGFNNMWLAERRSSINTDSSFINTNRDRSMVSPCRKSSPAQPNTEHRGGDGGTTEQDLRYEIKRKSTRMKWLLIISRISYRWLVYRPSLITCHGETLQ